MHLTDFMTKLAFSNFDSTHHYSTHICAINKTGYMNAEPVKFLLSIESMYLGQNSALKQVVEIQIVATRIKCNQLGRVCCTFGWDLQPYSDHQPNIPVY